MHPLWVLGQFMVNVGYRAYSIDFKELFAIVVVITWGSQWEGKHSVFVTYNLPITQIWHIGTSRSSDIMVLIRKLYIFVSGRVWVFCVPYIY